MLLKTKKITKGNQKLQDQEDSDLELLGKVWLL
jgi:hypothetical protein